MADLSTRYMGLELKNPLIVGSSPLTGTVEKVQEMADNGAGAVVLKTLFEEEVSVNKNYSCHFNLHPEAYNYDILDADMMYGVKGYTDLIRDSKKKVDIPVIASLHCVRGKWWSHYPKMMEDAGADAIEMNISNTAFSTATTPTEVAKRFIDAVRTVRSKVSIPVSVKFSPYSCSIPYLAKELQNAGANSLVTFSRFFKLGIDLESLQCVPMNYYSSEVETYKVLRWVGILHRQLPDIDICATTGIHSSNEALQHILAGAKAFQVVTTIYKNGAGIIQRILNKMDRWMLDKDFRTLEEMRGYVCNTTDPQFDRIHINTLTAGHYPLEDVI